jgi:hypothetical protein
MAKVRHLVARLIRRCSSVSGGGLSYTSRDLIANSLLAHDYQSRIILYERKQLLGLQITLPYHTGRWQTDDWHKRDPDHRQIAMWQLTCYYKPQLTIIPKAEWS